MSGFAWALLKPAAIFLVLMVVFSFVFPDPSYKLQLVVTKALAEEGNAAHVETWTSPTIVITR